MEKLKKIAHYPLALYAIIIVVLVVMDKLLDLQLELISGFVAYDIVNTFPKYINLLIWYMFLGRPVWLVIFLLNYMVGKDKPTVWTATSAFIHIVGVAAITMLGSTLVDKGQYVKHRYDHAVAQANERFEPV